MNSSVKNIMIAGSVVLFPFLAYEFNEMRKAEYREWEQKMDQEKIQHCYKQYKDYEACKNTYYEMKWSQ